MPADPETLTALARIQTTVEAEARRSEEDRKAGQHAREKIDAIHTSQQLTAQTLTAHIVEADRQFSRLHTDIESAHKRVDQVSINKTKAGAALGGAGFLGAVFDKLLAWFLQSGGHS